MGAKKTEKTKKCPARVPGEVRVGGRRESWECARVGGRRESLRECRVGAVSWGRESVGAMRVGGSVEWAP